MSWKYHWRTHPGVNKLEKMIDQLRMENIRLRREVETKQTQVGGLELALHQRHQTIDALNGKLEQARAQCRRLDEEAEGYVAMIQRGPLRERY
jgi:predicted RNase H-like nuclease (RuvC/YqgF family)